MQCDPLLSRYTDLPSKRESEVLPNCFLLNSTLLQVSKIWRFTSSIPNMYSANPKENSFAIALSRAIKVETCRIARAFPLPSNWNTKILSLFDLQKSTETRSYCRRQFVNKVLGNYEVGTSLMAYNTTSNTAKASFSNACRTPSLPNVWPWTATDPSPLGARFPRMSSRCKTMVSLTQKY